MSRLSKKSKKEIGEALIDALEDIMNEGSTTVRDKIKAIELIGREHGLFTERKQINVDIQSIVHQLSDRQLETIAQVDHGAPVIDVLPRLDVGEGAGVTGDGDREQGPNRGDKGPRLEDELGLDSEILGPDREETGREE